METWQHGLQLLTQGVHLCIGGFIEPPLLTTLCHEGIPAALGQSWRGLASSSRSTRAQTLYIPVLTSLLDLPVSFSCTPVWNTAGVRHRWPFTLLSFICIKWEHLLRPCVLYLLLVVWVFLKYIFDRVSCSSGCLQVCYVVKDDPSHLILPLSREKMPCSGIYSWRLNTVCLLSSFFFPLLLPSEFITKLSWLSTVQTNKAPSLGNRTFFLPRKMIHLRRGQTNQFKMSTPEGKTLSCSRYCGDEGFQDSKQQEM